jgi:hypothetical protein
MIIGIIGMIFAPMLPHSSDFPTADIVKALGALVLASLTFLGGYLGGKDKN